MDLSWLNIFYNIYYHNYWIWYIHSAHSKWSMGGRFLLPTRNLPHNCLLSKEYIYFSNGDLQDPACWDLLCDFFFSNCASFICSHWRSSLKQSRRLGTAGGCLLLLGFLLHYRVWRLRSSCRGPLGFPILYSFNLWMAYRNLYD